MLSQLWRGEIHFIERALVKGPVWVPGTTVTPRDSPFGITNWNWSKEKAGPFLDPASCFGNLTLSSS